MSESRPHDVLTRRGVAYCWKCACYRPSGQDWDDDCEAAPAPPEPPFGKTPSPVAEAFDRALGETAIDRIDRMIRRR